MEILFLILYHFRMGTMKICICVAKTDKAIKQYSTYKKCQQT